MVCGSCIAAAAAAGAGTMAFFRLVDMVRDGGVRKTLAFLRGERSLRGRRSADDDVPEGPDQDVLTGSRS